VYDWLCFQLPASPNSPSPSYIASTVQTVMRQTRQPIESTAISMLSDPCMINQYLAG
jgi:hypothetical protein